MSKDWEKIVSRKTLLILFVVLLAIPACLHSSTEPYKYSLCDIRVMYFYEDAGHIDWPVLYYLNDKYGCRIDLISVRPGQNWDIQMASLEDKEIYFKNYNIDVSDSLWTKKIINKIFDVRYPDVVIFGMLSTDLYKTLKSEIINIPKSADRYFSIQKIYQLSDPNEKVKEKSLHSIVISRRELFKRYEDRIRYEIPRLLPYSEFDYANADNLATYLLIKKDTYKPEPEADFISGIETNRMAEIIDNVLPAGPRRDILKQKADNFIAYFNNSRHLANYDKVNYIVDGYRELTELVHKQKFDDITAHNIDFLPYLTEYYNRVEKSALRVIGINWEGKIFLRDSPHGAKVKIRVIVSVDSPVSITLSNLVFHPYWDTSKVILTEKEIEILPHQTFEREYLVDIDPLYLEASKPESLLFSADILYRKNSMTFMTSLPVWEAPEIDIKFIPDFQFIEPFKDLDVDRVITTNFVRIEISKPKNYANNIRLQLETPRGMFAGSYRSEHTLEKGSTGLSVRIPFSISNLFDNGIQHQYIKLYVDGKLVAADTGLVRVASSHISDKVQIGFLPDTSGMLEDILRMTDADFKPLTERTLLTYDINVFDVILIGSGAFRKFDAVTKIKIKFEEYLRQGGSIVLLGQPADWPEGVLPIGFVPYEEFVEKSEITNRITEAVVLSKPYPISDKNLLSSFFQKRKVQSAVVTPAEVVYETASGGTLLSVSRLGDGQVIYCGLPLLEMIARLDIDAIHLLANILNY